MSRLGSYANSWRESYGGQQSDNASLRGEEPREPGARRKKLAGYLKAANDLRQTYTQSYTQGWRGQQFDDPDDGTAGHFPEEASVRTGEEEMVLFPSYATKHVKRKPQSVPGTIQETSGAGRDSRDTGGAGDAEFWRQEWERYEDDHAIVDVDVRGWIYSPFKGQMSRKQRLFVGLARQMVGIPAPPSENSSQANSRNSSPTGQRERMQAQAARKDEEYVAQQAESIVRKGEAEAKAAGKGQYSEQPGKDTDKDSLSADSRGPSPVRPSRINELRHASSKSSLKSNASSDDRITGIQKRASWNQPANMSQEELTQAHTHLMTRLKPFMAIPMANTAISVFFYNEKISRQRTVHTNGAGHFSVRAALDFIPTHVRVLASEKLSSTVEVQVTSAKGVSLISDIDDTIKHSAISVGAREIFRNAFIRELDDLTIEGVQEWYNRLADLGVKFHYVSNSPWQLFPVIEKFFSLAGLPPGSFHLKQYSGMLQGIFEPVAERKKGTLDRLARDFPERKFILVGDSGEADLEVYMDFVAENPGRVIAVFIRDVTTSHHGGFFDSSMGRLAGDRSPNTAGGSAVNGASNAAMSPNDDDDPEFQAAIAASIKQLEEEDRRRGRPRAGGDENAPHNRPGLPDRRPTGPAAIEAHRGAQASQNLIDFSDDETTTSPPFRPKTSKPESFAPSHGLEELNTSSARTKAAPPPTPKKPAALRSLSLNTPQSPSANPTSSSQTSNLPSASVPSKPPPPPKPRRSSAMIYPQHTAGSVASTTSLSSQYTTTSQQSYLGSARQKLSSAYNSLPSAREARDYWYGNTEATSQQGNNPYADYSFAPPNPNQRGPVPPPTRRTVSTYPSTLYAHSGFAQQSQQNAYSTSSGGQGNGNGGFGEEISKRELLWRQRWGRAQQVMREKGVVLRTWRVGTDVLEESEKLVEKYTKEAEKDSEKVEGEIKREERREQGRRS